jgi:hypothetical protein
MSKLYKERMCRLTANALSLMTLVFLLPGKASAYVDPGSGALLWQTIVAGFLGLAFHFRRYVIRFLRGNKREP